MQGNSKAYGPNVNLADSQVAPAGIFGLTHEEILRSEWVDSDSLTVKFVLEVRPYQTLQSVIQPLHDLHADDVLLGAEGLFFLVFLFFLAFCSFGAFSLFFLGKQHVPYILDGFRAISLGFPKKTLIPFFLEANATQEGRKEESKETRKEEGRKERKQGSKEARKPGSKEARKEDRRKKARQQQHEHQEQ